VIVHWNTEDPFAEKSRRLSPFNYCEDNPIRNVDLEGDSSVNPGSKSATRGNSADNLEKTGTYLSILGTMSTITAYGLAPFTDGESLEALPYTQAISSLGVTATVADDVSKNDDKGAILTATPALIFGAAGSGLNALENAGQLSSVQKPILGALLETGNQAVDYGVDKANARNNDNTTKTPTTVAPDIKLPKLPALDSNKTMQRDIHLKPPPPPSKKKKDGTAN
jgi:hypothetical protein